ncbi:hypothetical protein D3C76_1581060 [compost metagenome]
MLVRTGVAQDRGYMDAAFVSKCSSPDIRLINRHVHIGNLADIAGRVGQLLKLFGFQYFISHFKLEIGDNRA